jgi:hypothetical protein
MRGRPCCRKSRAASSAILGRTPPLGIPVAYCAGKACDVL